MAWLFFVVVGELRFQNRLQINLWKYLKQWVKNIIRIQIWFFLAFAQQNLYVLGLWFWTKLLYYLFQCFYAVVQALFSYWIFLVTIWAFDDFVFAYFIMMTLKLSFKLFCAFTYPAYYFSFWANIWVMFVHFLSFYFIVTLFATYFLFWAMIDQMRIFILSNNYLWT